MNTNEKTHRTGRTRLSGSVTLQHPSLYIYITGAILTISIIAVAALFYANKTGNKTVATLLKNDKPTVSESK